MLAVKVRQRTPDSYFFTIEICNPEPERSVTLRAVWGANSEVTVWETAGSKIDSLEALPTVLEPADWVEVTVKQWQPWSSVRIKYEWEGESIRDEEVQIQSGDAVYGEAARWSSEDDYSDSYY